MRKSKRSSSSKSSSLKVTLLIKKGRKHSEFMPREGQSSGSLSSRAELEGSWLERQWQTKVEARSETQPDHGGEHHRANLPSGTRWMQKRPIRQRCPRQQARHPCVRTVSECRPAARPRPCGYRSRAIVGRPYKPTSRKFRGRPEAPPVQQIRPPDRQKNGVMPVTDQGRCSSKKH